MTRPGFAFSTRFKVRYAEIDGQKVVFNSRYLEYADVAVTEFWLWTGIGEALGALWHDTEFHVRRAEVDYLAPFVWGDEVEAFVRVERLGGSSITKRFELVKAGDGTLCAAITIVSVNVHLPTGRPVPIPDAIRDFISALPQG
ncbi:MAG: 4-hydroxybenzoyl-CoA thioesterase [Sphingomonas sp.]|jgi:acyl-CoA thioester hydrolase|uniref:acyl-CoA thioesterase n=1 Tax=Sphingomonas sp. TaxID=28214 RepID=UPI000DBC2522|nr:thioesterase family protein [Sphingomonas sp.]PZU80515.1 MAG: 4-hydroxybenzoyl-CoA thioesterase [Sphingomonas sp.]